MMGDFQSFQASGALITWHCKIDSDFPRRAAVLHRGTYVTALVTNPIKMPRIPSITLQSQRWAARAGSSSDKIEKFQTFDVLLESRASLWVSPGVVLYRCRC